MIKILNKNDWREMGRLRCQRATHAGASIDAITTSPLVAVNTRYQLEPNLAIGWIENEKLAAYICCYSADDFWVLDLMVSSGDPKQLRECLEYCLGHYEARGITKMYYAFPKKWARAYNTYWREGAPLLRKYKIEDVGFVEPYKVPSDPWVWEHILHEIVVPVPLLIRLSSC